MNNPKTLKVTLMLSGLIGVYVGIEILFFPIAFYATSGIDVAGDVSLLNEVRASGGALLLSGIIIILGAFLPRLAFTSILISTVLYLSYGFSRVVSMVIDGRPADILVYVSALEIAIGLVCALMLAKFLKYEQKRRLSREAE